MNYFLKLNVVSMLYGLIFFISLEIEVNYYRIVRLTGWEGQSFDTLVLVVQGIGFVVATIALYMLTYKWIAHRRLVYWTTIFWMPYTAFFIFIQQKTSTSEDGEMYEVLVLFQWVSKHQLNEDKILMSRILKGMNCAGTIQNP